MLYTIVGWVSYQMFKKKGGGGWLTGSQFLKGVTGKEGKGVTFFSGGLQFLHKKWTKIWDIQQQKKFKQKCFSLSWLRI